MKINIYNNKETGETVEAEAGSEIDAKIAEMTEVFELVSGSAPEVAEEVVETAPEVEKPAK